MTNSTTKRCKGDQLRKRIPKAVKFPYKNKGPINKKTVNKTNLFNMWNQTISQTLRTKFRSYTSALDLCAARTASALAFTKRHSCIVI